MECCGQAQAKVTTRDDPFVIGDPADGVTRCRCTVNIEGLYAGDIGWFSGTSIPALIANATLVPV